MTNENLPGETPSEPTLSPGDTKSAGSGEPLSTAAEPQTSCAAARSCRQLDDLARALDVIRDPRRFIWFLRAIRVDIAERRRDAEAMYIAAEHFNRFDEMEKMGKWLDFYGDVNRLILAAFGVAQIGMTTPVIDLLAESLRVFAQDVIVTESVVTVDPTITGRVDEPTSL